MKIKIFVACEIQYFEIGIFSFNSYVYYLTRGFIASTRAFNLPTRAFNLLTCAFNLAAHAFNITTCAFSLLTHGFELVTCGFKFVPRGLELVTRNSYFTFPRLNWPNKVRVTFNQPSRKRLSAKLVDAVKHLPHKVFLSWHHH